LLVGRIAVPEVTTTTVPAAAADAAAVKARAARVEALLALPWLTCDEAAAVVAASVSSIRRACKSGRLRHVRLNSAKLIRLRPADLIEWASPSA
jgi:excisionase family DNA binding protein